jgi:hypothetical protein
MAQTGPLGQEPVSPLSRPASELLNATLDLLFATPRYPQWMKWAAIDSKSGMGRFDGTIHGPIALRGSYRACPQFALRYVEQAGLHASNTTIISCSAPL